MAHKDHYQKIVELWRKILKKSKFSSLIMTPFAELGGRKSFCIPRVSVVLVLLKTQTVFNITGQPKHRLTLFYVANDVVQYARRKRVNDLYNILKGAIADVVPLLREDSIVSSVQRVLSVRIFVGIARPRLDERDKSNPFVRNSWLFDQVWLEREIFDEDFVQELRDSLDKQKLQAAQNAKIVERFKPTEMTEKIQQMISMEMENEKKLKLLKLVKVDVSSPEAIQQIKGVRLSFRLSVSLLDCPSLF